MNTSVNNIKAVLQIEQENQLREKRVSVIRLVQIQALRTPLIISVVLQLGQQLSGINAVSCSHFCV